MKSIIILTLPLFFACTINGQVIDSLQKEKQRFLSNISNFQDSIKKIDSQINIVMKSGKYKMERQQFLLVTVKESSPIKLFPELSARNIGFIKKGDTLKVYRKVYQDLFENFLKSTDTGFIYLKYLNSSDDLIFLLKEFETEKDSIQGVQNKIYQKENEAKKAKLIASYGAANAKKILEGKIWLGMTANMAIQSWGRPEKINTTSGTFGKHEQWIYPNNVYLYFENNILTAWQD